MDYNNIKVVRLESQNQYFDIICDWYEAWLGKVNQESKEEIRYTFAHSLNTVRLPQTFIALVNEEVVGMYQLAVFDDLNCRPDLYPWIINVYVDNKHRNHGVCKAMMLSVKENAREAGLSELYLYTKHIGLYEKYGWEFQEEVNSFKDGIVRIYKLEI